MENRAAAPGGVAAVRADAAVAGRQCTITAAHWHNKGIGMSTREVVAIIFGVVLGAMLMISVAYAMWAAMRAHDGD